MKLSEKTLKVMGFVFIIIGILFELVIISKKAKNNTFDEFLPIAILLWVIGISLFILAKKKKEKDENLNGN